MVNVFQKPNIPSPLRYRGDSVEYVSVSRLKSGMVLSGDLVAPNGRFILPKGASLTSKNILSLKIWGVSEVPVAKSAEEGEGSKGLLFSSSVMEEAETIVLNLFSGQVPPSPLMKAVFSVAVKEAAGRISGGKTPYGPTVFSFSLKTKRGIFDEKLDLDEILMMEDGLVSFPDVYFRISEALQSPKTSITHIADLISKDTALSASLLKLANSAIYGVPTKVDSISRAAALIGGRALSLLALGVSAVTMFKNIPVEWVDMESFWKHSVSVAVIAQILASRRDPRVIEQVFVAGMLHDIGRLLLFRNAPFTMARLIAEAAEDKVPLEVREKEALGFHHGELGGRLLKSWDFPQSLWDPIRKHHGPDEDIKDVSSALLAAADVLAAVMGEGNSGSLHVPPLGEEIWKIIDLPFPAIDLTAKQAHRQIKEIYRLFEGGGLHGKTVSNP